MSWATFSNLISGAKPIWLYMVEFGNQTAYYTTSARPVDTVAGFPLVGAQTWTPQTIAAPSLRRSKSDTKQQVSISFPKSDEFISQFLQDNGMLSSRITIWHGFEGDPDREYIQMFSGSVYRVKPNWFTITLMCNDEFGSLQDKGLSHIIQRPCTYPVYFGGCRLNVADWQSSHVITATSGTRYTIANIAADYGAHYFSGGLIEFGGNRQMITTQSSNQIVLLGALPGLKEEIELNGSATVLLAPGCPKTLIACHEKFNNVLNYGGFPWLTDSPYDGRRIL